MPSSPARGNPWQENIMPKVGKKETIGRGLGIRGTHLGSTKRQGLNWKSQSRAAKVLKTGHEGVTGIRKADGGDPLCLTGGGELMIQIHSGLKVYGGLEASSCGRVSGALGGPNLENEEKGQSVCVGTVAGEEVRI